MRLARWLAPCPSSAFSWGPRSSIRSSRWFSGCRSCSPGSSAGSSSGRLLMAIVYAIDPVNAETEAGKDGERR